jgi:hypothetical protein
MGHAHAQGFGSRAAGRVLLAAALGACGLRGDEGMWTFDNLPVQRMQVSYGFAPDRAWLDHVRLATLRLPGGSGAFVSRDGLVLTNHHIAHAWIERIADAGHDYVKDGFVAQDRRHELRVPGLEARTLMATENVTEALRAAVSAACGTAGEDAARRAILARMIQAAERRTGFASEPVVLYQGGETWIYSYAVHSDVRLVLAPEYGVAAFGREWDNFTFPRHDLDFALFRVYEQGVPYHPPQFLRWARTGLRAGDLTVVVGHPGRTARQETLAQLEATRDVLDPLRLRDLDRQRQALRDFAAQGPEPARLVSAQLLNLENSCKIYRNEIAGLQDVQAMARVAAAERELREQVAADPVLRASAGSSWDRVAEAVRTRLGCARESAMLTGRGSRALAFAQGLVRWKVQAARPESERELGYRSGRDEAQLRAALGFGEVLEPGVEQASLAGGLAQALAELGPAHPLAAALLEGRDPGDRARELVTRTRLLRPEVRRGWIAASPAEVLASPDPMLVLARKLEALAGPYRRLEGDSDAVLADHGARIARARFALRGRTEYPDATFSLRLSYGAVASCPANGTRVQPFTTFGGLFDRADGWGAQAEGGAWALPPRWRLRRPRLDPSTPFNFISSNDIIGGNSGSPVLDRQGDLVGLVFDGNLGEIPGRFYYDSQVNRAVSLDARAILAAMTQVYDAPDLVAELLAAP